MRDLGFEFDATTPPESSPESSVCVEASPPEDARDATADAAPADDGAEGARKKPRLSSGSDQVRSPISPTTVQWCSDVNIYRSLSLQFDTQSGDNSNGNVGRQTVVNIEEDSDEITVNEDQDTTTVDTTEHEPMEEEKPSSLISTEGPAKGMHIISFSDLKLALGLLAVTC